MAIRKERGEKTVSQVYFLFSGAGTHPRMFPIP